MENYFPMDGYTALCHDLPKMTPWLPEETTYDGCWKRWQSDVLSPWRRRLSAFKVSRLHGDSAHAPKSRHLWRFI